MGNQHTSADAPKPGLVRITLEDAKDRAELWLSQDNLRWVIETLEQLLTIYGYPSTSQQMHGDQLCLFEGGHEQNPYIHLINKRAANTAQSGTYALQLRKAIVRKLMEQLQAL